MTADIHDTMFMTVNSVWVGVMETGHGHDIVTLVMVVTLSYSTQAQQSCLIGQWFCHGGVNNTGQEINWKNLHELECISNIT